MFMFVEAVLIFFSTNISKSETIQNIELNILLSNKYCLVFNTYTYHSIVTFCIEALGKINAIKRKIHSFKQRTLILQAEKTV